MRPDTAEDRSRHFLRQVGYRQAAKDAKADPVEKRLAQIGEPRRQSGQGKGAGIDLANVAAGGQIAARGGLKFGDVGLRKVVQPKLRRVGEVFAMPRGWAVEAVGQAVRHPGR
jgi:hypothetical protein